MAKKYSDRVITPLVENSVIVKEEVYFHRQLIAYRNSGYDKYVNKISRKRTDLTKIDEAGCFKGVILYEYENSVTVYIEEGSHKGLYAIRKAYLLKKDGDTFKAMYPELDFGYYIYEDM